MDFYYPNPTNDFWRIIGLVIYGDRDRLYDPATRTFHLDLIHHTLDRYGIALHDTAREVRRLRDNASDKYLEIITPAPLLDLLARIPQCLTVASTGEKAAGIIASLTGSEIPPMGSHTTACLPTAKAIDIWRMPSTSRAYPLSLEKKAAHYSALLHSAGII